jgi:hypothetical protein
VVAVIDTTADPEVALRAFLATQGDVNGRVAAMIK